VVRLFVVLVEPYFVFGVQKQAHYFLPVSAYESPPQTLAIIANKPNITLAIL
jgi:hypothetical protein